MSHSTHIHLWQGTQNQNFSPIGSVGAELETLVLKKKKKEKEKKEDESALVDRRRRR